MNTRTYEWLDAVVVGLSLLIIGGTIAVLAFCEVPQNNLPIIASLAGTLLGTIVGGYAGFRWGSSIASKQAADAATATGKAATDALAQIAGATVPAPVPTQAGQINVTGEKVDVTQAPKS